MNRVRFLPRLRTARRCNWAQNRARHAHAPTDVIHIPKSSIAALGEQRPVLRDVSWTVRPHEAWAVVGQGGSSSKDALFGALMGTYKISPYPPPPGGLFPFLEGLDAYQHVRSVRFAHRAHGAGDGFYDFTARYGAVREEDRRTLRETFFPHLAKPVHSLAIPAFYTPKRRTFDEDEDDAETRRREQEHFDFLTSRLALRDLLDLPMIALSNGQTRRARIAQALLAHPALLILDEPLTGLDAHSRGVLLALLQELHKQKATSHIILGLRTQDPLPEWTTHVALLHEDGTVRTGRKDDVLSTAAAHPAPPPVTPHKPSYHPRTLGEPLIDLAGINVRYGPRTVLDGIHWTIRQNARWHLIGENGAGKTTLLAMLTGEHPQSYAESAKLTLFGKPRARWPTPALHRRIGRVSPELHNAFPRRHSMSVWDAIGTGFDGGFVPKGKRRLGWDVSGRELETGGRDEEWRMHRMHAVMAALGPSRWQRAGGKHLDDEKFFKRSFSSLMPGEQSMVLLMRALVGEPDLVLLDEAWAGMDRAMVEAAHMYLADGGGGLSEKQACIVVSHWEEEVPWDAQNGVARFKLDRGRGKQISP